MLKRSGTVLWIAAFVLQQGLLGASSAFAQAQSNTDFQQELGRGRGSGGTPASPGFQGVQVGSTGQQPEANLYQGTEEASPLDTRVTVRVKKAPLAAFLDTISAQAKVNFIIASGLSEITITAFLRSVTVREALQILQQIKGLTYQRVGKSNTYIISRRRTAEVSTITKIYTLNYIPLVPIESTGAETAAITSQASGLSASLPQSAQSAASAGGAGAGGSSGGTVSILNVVQSVLSAKGKVSVEPRTNSIIITDLPEVFPQVEQILAELDKKAPQVLIEAQIVEIDTDKVNELGIQWGGAKGEMAFYQAGAQLTDWPFRPNINKSWNQFFPSGGALGSVGASALGAASAGSGAGSSGVQLDGVVATGLSAAARPDIFLGIFSLAQLQAVFRALIQRSEARFLGKPKILAINNKTSVIQIVQDQAVGVATQIAGSDNQTASTTAAERRTTGLTLKVTPQVNREGFITMLVQPSFIDVVESRTSSPSNPMFDPISRGLSTMVRVKNGQTVVMGGLLSSREHKVVRKVPLLGYIPVLGWLFTSVSSDRKNTDLVIFITPTIIND